VLTFLALLKNSLVLSRRPLKGYKILFRLERHKMRKSETIKHHNVRISEILEFQKRQNIRTREYQNQNMRTSESEHYNIIS
jgi:hypothetical protein